MLILLICLIALLLGGLGFFLHQVGHLRARLLEKALLEKALLEAHQREMETQKRAMEELKNHHARELSSLQESMVGKLATQKELQETLSKEFERISGRIFQSQGTTLQENSLGALRTTLTPLQRDLEGFKRLVDDRFQREFEQQSALKTHIEHLHSMHKGLQEETQKLTMALRGDNRFQGAWGEMILERILEESGLRKGREYTVQGEGLQLSHAHHEGHMKPDVIVNLPDDKCIVIDAKVSLKAYELFCNTHQEGYKKQFLAALKTQIEDLHQHAYQAMEGLRTPDFVLMFVPIEPAFMMGIQQDPTLFSFAWKKRIVLSSPSTLMATLRTIASLWQIDNQNKNANDIAREAGKLYDKIVGFLDDLTDLGKSLESAGKKHMEVMSKLQDGRGNILKRIDDIKKLGAKTTKIPKTAKVIEMMNISLAEEMQEVQEGGLEEASEIQREQEESDRTLMVMPTEEPEETRDTSGSSV